MWKENSSVTLVCTRQVSRLVRCFGEEWKGEAISFCIIYKSQDSPLKLKQQSHCLKIKIYFFELWHSRNMNESLVCVTYHTSNCPEASLDYGKSHKSNSRWSLKHLALNCFLIYCLNIVPRVFVWSTYSDSPKWYTRNWAKWSSRLLEYLMAAGYMFHLL